MFKSILIQLQRILNHRKISMANKIQLSSIKTKKGSYYTSLFSCPIFVGNIRLFRSYFRNKPTNTNNATSPAKPDSPKLFMMVVRLPITLTPKMPVPNITSDTAPIATKDNIKWPKSSIHPLNVVTISFIWFSPVS